MASLVLGVCGKKRSGKDSFASRLVSDHGFTRIGFADALRDVALDLDPVITFQRHRDHSADEFLEVTLLDVLGPEDDWEVAKEVPEVRRLLQFLGVAVRDHVSPSAWIDALARKAAAVPGPVVITDVRFPNEADWVRGAGGRLARIHRPGLVSADEHVSETALDHRSPDFYVCNSGTTSDLYSKADTVAHALLRHAW